MDPILATLVQAAIGKAADEASAELQRLTADGSLPSASRQPLSRTLRDGP
jgi:hypothetical protein